MNRNLLAVLTCAFTLSLSCKKVNENPDQGESASPTAISASNGARVSATPCDYEAPENVNNFLTQNQVTDAPISAATGGTEEENARDNYQKIQWCLVKYGRAYLNSGNEFVVNHTLILDNAVLISANGDWPTIRAISNYSNKLIKLNHNCRVAFLTLNADKHFRAKDNNASVIEIGGDGNQVDNNVIGGGSVPLYNTDAYSIAGVYIMCGDNNTIWNNQIKNNHSGVIITKPIGFATPANNVITENRINENRSDGITFVTYGKALNNIIKNNGWDCQNGGAGSPIPGAGIYSEGNHDGALIEGNTIYDNTGHNIDLTGIQHFIIKNNIVYNPGNNIIPGISNPIVAGGAMSVCIVDGSNCVIENNDIRNEARSCNKVGGGGWWGKDVNRFFSKNANSDLYSDLPFGGNSIIAFGLIESRCNRINDSGQVVYVINQVRQNTIRNNIFIASPNGIGYFASRNTGFDLNNVWSASTTNYYTLNNPNGSNVGSVRCGGNWYAANGIDANADDNQHQPPSSSWSGNLIGKEWYDGTCAPEPVSQPDYDQICNN